MNKNKKQQGQSLLEMIFAIGILLAVVSAVLALSISSIAGQKASEFQIVANNLARESIEVVRNMRDSNWLAEIDWDSAGSWGLGLNGGQTLITKFDRSANTWQLEPTCTNALLYTSAGVYSHDPAGQASVFSRCLTLNNICLESGGEEIKDSACAGEKIGIKITVEVSWSERGQNRTITLEDLLYGWK